MDLIANEYAEKNGIKLHDFVFLANDSVKGHGIYTKEDLNPSTVILSVPYAAFITAERIVKNTNLQQIFVDNPWLLDNPDEVISIGLMYGRLHSDCEWNQHIALMPTEFNTTIYWSENEVAALTGLNIFHLTNLMKAQIGRDYESIHSPLSNNYPELLNGVTIDLYKWALSVVYSRSIDITRKNKNVRCIVPLLDMANHDPSVATNPDETFHYDEQKDEISLIAPHALAAGSECCAIYGKYSNEKLLYSYGFIIPHNPIKTVDLWTKVSSTTTEAELKQQLLSNNPLTMNKFYDFSGTIRDNYISPALLATIRIIQCDENDFNHHNVYNAFNGKMISVRNECATYASLKNLLINRMRIESAETEKNQLGKLLLDGATSQNRFLCALTLRVDEREIIQQALVLVQRWVEQINELGEKFLPFDCPK